MATPIIPKKLQSIINDINEEARYAIYPKISDRFFLKYEFQFLISNQ